MLKGAKKLFDCPEQRAISDINAKITNYVRERSVPCKVLKKGTYLISTEILKEVNDNVRDLKQQFNAAVETFTKPEVYLSEKEEACTRINSLADPSQYLSPDGYKARCYIETSYFDIDVPDKLKEVDPAIHIQQSEFASI